MSEIKLWRFRSQVLPQTDPNIVYVWKNPVPILVGPKMVGAASIDELLDCLYADCIADYSLPERLEVEAGHRIWTLPNVVVTPASLYSELPHTVIEVTSLSLRNDCYASEHEPIGT